MKTILSVLLILAHIPLCAQTIIPKKANTIIISGDFTQEQCFNDIMGVLIENGFGIQSSDKVVGNITTNQRDFKNGSIRLMIMVQEKKVTVRGQWMWREWPTDIEEWDDINYGGQKNSPRLNSWNAMINITDQISGTKTYLTR